MILGSVIQVLEAANCPLEFDIIDNFSMDNPEHKKLLKKNQNILIGNVGSPGSKYVENRPLYKFLDLNIKGEFLG